MLREPPTETPLEVLLTAVMHMYALLQQVPGLEAPDLTLSEQCTIKPQ